MSWMSPVDFLPLGLTLGFASCPLSVRMIKPKLFDRVRFLARLLLIILLAVRFFCFFLKDLFTVHWTYLPQGWSLVCYYIHIFKKQ